MANPTSCSKFATKFIVCKKKQIKYKLQEPFCQKQKEAATIPEHLRN